MNGTTCALKTSASSGTYLISMKPSTITSRKLTLEQNVLQENMTSNLPSPLERLMNLSKIITDGDGTNLLTRLSTVVLDL